MNFLTSSTGTKWRAVSIIMLRHPNRGLELFQRVFGIEEAGAVTRLNFHALRLDRDLVSFRPQGFVSRLFEDFRRGTHAGGGVDFGRFRDDLIGTGFHVVRGKDAAAHH